MSNLIINEIPDVSLNVVSDSEINITLVEQPSVVVEFDVAQGPSGPKGDTGNVTQEMLSVLSQATAQASLAAGYAASASSVVQQDLSGVNAAALHRSPNAVTAMFVYDTSKDSDGGAWTEKCQHTSWYNEPINGKWLGAHASETNARNEGATLGSELVTNGTFDTDTTGWTSINATLSAVSGVLRLTKTSVNGQARTTVPTVIGKVYRVTATLTNRSVAGVVANLDLGTSAGGTQYARTAVAGIGVLNGSVTVYFTATATTAYLGLYSVEGTGFEEWDNISVREVTAQTTQTGDYFQLSTDGKFYRLNAGSGTTEVFRGNKRDFPRLAGIVAEAANVTIYDLTEAGRPMAFRFLAGSSAINWWQSSATVTSLAMVNGVLCVGSSSNGIRNVRFAEDKFDRIGTSTSFVVPAGGVATRNGAATTGGYATQVIANINVNAVAMTVLPDANRDPVTGLPIPTIAVATAGGISVIQDTGIVRNSSSTSAYTKVIIDEKEVGAVYASGFAVSGPPRSLGASFSLTNYTTTAAPALMGAPTVVV